MISYNLGRNIFVRKCVCNNMIDKNNKTRQKKPVQQGSSHEPSEGVKGIQDVFQREKKDQVPASKPLMQGKPGPVKGHPGENPRNRKPVGSKGKKFNTAKVIKSNSKRRESKESANINQEGEKKTRRASNFAKLSKNLSEIRSKKKRISDLEPWQKEALKGSKIYKLTAFTTTDNIDRKFASYRRQAIMRKLLVTLIIILLISTLIGKVFNFSNISEFQLITGEDSITDFFLTDRNE